MSVPTEINLVDSGTVTWTAGPSHPDPSNPQLMIRDVQASASGATGINWRGTWSSVTNYFVDDAVSLGGSSYVCISANTNHSPPNATYWDSLASGASVPAMGASGPSHSAGQVPDPGSVAGSDRFLCEDATFRTPMDALSEKRWAFIGIGPGGSTSGSANFTVVGDSFVTSTLGSNMAQVCGTATTPNYVGCMSMACGATSGNGDRISGSLFWAAGKNIKMKGYVAHDATQVRLWFGMLTQGASALNVDTLGTVKGAAFRFSTVVPDTNYQCVCSDGSSQTVVDSGVAVAADTFHRFEIIFNDSVPNVVFKIDGAVVATITTHLPAANTLLGMFYDLTTQANVTKTSYIQSIGIAADA